MKPRRRERKEQGFLLREFLACRQDMACIERKIARYRDYMPFGFTLAEIGEILGVTRERVRQIEKAALKKLRHPSVGRRLRDYLNDTL